MPSLDSHEFKTEAEIKAAPTLFDELVAKLRKEHPDDIEFFKAKDKAFKQWWIDFKNRT